MFTFYYNIMVKKDHYDSDKSRIFAVKNGIDVLYFFSWKISFIALLLRKSYKTAFFVLFVNFVNLKNPDLEFVIYLSMPFITNYMCFCELSLKGFEAIGLKILSPIEAIFINKTIFLQNKFSISKWF